MLRYRINGPSTDNSHIATRTGASQKGDSAVGGIAEQGDEPKVEAGPQENGFRRTQAGLRADEEVLGESSEGPLVNVGFSSVWRFADQQPCAIW